MADGAVGFLLQTLHSLLQEEASLIQELRRSIREIQRELEWMRTFLKDADRRQSNEDRVRTWVKQVRDATYEVEDIIDKYMYRMAKQNRGGGLPRVALNNSILLPKRWWYKHRIAIELQSIKSEIKSISQGSKTYGFQQEGSTSKTNVDAQNWQRSGEYARYISDDEIVGIEENKNFFIRRLTDGRPELLVLSVVGMGGLGKTTLVTKAYYSSQVKNHFDCCAWITVSQSYKVDDILRSMINELLYKTNEEAIPESLGKMTTGNLVETVINYLHDKRYVIVLDDVWAIDVWKDIHVALPNNGRGGRIMLTTRYRHVALFFGCEQDILQLQPLGKDDAWALFCKRVFPNETCPPELKLSAESIVQKCEGLPLAIVTIRGLMLTKEKSSSEWNNVAESLGWQLLHNRELGQLRNVLLLSYNDLPYNLKQCFLYCSLFPEDYEIPQKRLIRLWVAEGFIEEQGGLTLEDVAADYIQILACRSLVQVVIDDVQWLRKSVRMHDVLRELASTIGNEENFCNVCDEKKEDQKYGARRFLLHNSIPSIKLSTARTLRTLMLFAIEITPALWGGIASSIKLLRVLDLRNCSIKRVLSDEIVQLFNLRYLCLKNTNVEELPKSIGRLQNLQTLDIRNSRIKRLPRGVEKLKKLRHLLAYHLGVSKGFKNFDYAETPAGVCNLKCLQALECVRANDDTVREVGNLNKLRALAVVEVRRSHGVELCASLQKLGSLVLLRIGASTEEEVLDLGAMHHPPDRLENLILTGRLERLPHWINSLRNLTRVILRWSQLKEDPMSGSPLQALPNLMHLYFEKAYVGNKLCISRGCFTKLKTLYFIDFPELNGIKIEKESMKCIENLFLFNCPRLKSVPKGIQYLTSLLVLHLKEVSGELIEKILGNEGGILQQIPRILLHSSDK